MENFHKRRDRFDFFERFENPLLNICYELEVEDFRPFCKDRGYPVFHFFLYCLSQALNEVENFRYRIYQGEVIMIERLIGSYTVINNDDLFNYTRFEFENDLDQFIRNSLAARDQSLAAPGLVNTGIELSERELKNYVFLTSLPWLRFTSIEHPVYRFKSADIPSISWGKFSADQKGLLRIPFSVQAHHGFVDGHHIHLLGQTLRKWIQHTST